MPTLRLVLGGESPVGDTRVSPDESTTVDRWADEPRSLLALAVALEHLVGPEPEPDNAVWLVEGATWDDRLHRAADILVEVSNRDASALRAATGGPYDGQPPPGHRLLVLAAIRIERGTAQ